MRRIVVLCGLHARGTAGVLMEEGGSDAVVVCADDAEVWMDRSPPPDLWSPEVDMDHLKLISEDCLMEGACTVWVHAKIGCGYIYCCIVCSFAPWNCFSSKAISLICCTSLYPSGFICFVLWPFCRLSHLGLSFKSLS